MKLFKFQSSETDFIAAETQEHAADLYRREYGLHERDMEGVEITEADPASVWVYPDGWDYEDDDTEPPTAAEFMTKPSLVCSTCQ